MTIKYVTRFILVCSLFNIVNGVLAAESTGGCLVRTQEKTLFDPTCKCLEKKLCASPTKIKYKEESFARKNSKGMSIYPEKEKKLHKDSYEVYNKIIELKSQGKGDSQEAKGYYLKLTKLNSAILESYKKNHPHAEKVIQNSQEKARKKISQKLKQREKTILDEMKKSVGYDIASTDLKEKVENIQHQLNHEVIPKKNINPALVSQSETDNRRLSSEDRKIILKSLKPSDYNKDQDDSIFDIISKTYKSRAYKELLYNEGDN